MYTVVKMTASDLVVIGGPLRGRNADISLVGSALIQLVAESVLTQAK
jgi:hypothetical protein